MTNHRYGCRCPQCNAEAARKAAEKEARRLAKEAAAQDSAASAPTKPKPPAKRK